MPKNFEGLCPSVENIFKNNITLSKFELIRGKTSARKVVNREPLEKY